VLPKKVTAMEIRMIMQRIIARDWPAQERDGIP
jgi:hypothetical protein